MSATRKGRAGPGRSRRRGPSGRRRRRRPEHVPGRPLHERQQPGHRRPAGGPGRAPGAAAGGGLQHEHLWRRALCRRQTAASTSRRRRTARAASGRANGSRVGADGERLVPLPTPEDKSPRSRPSTPSPSGSGAAVPDARRGAYGIPTVALRFFNAYGSRQASPTLTPACWPFSRRACSTASRPQLFEDGWQQRDFVNVRDVARACALALTRDEAVGHALNVGSGRPPLDPRDRPAHGRGAGPRRARAADPGRYRAGDIRHCFADSAQARALLGL